MCMMYNHGMLRINIYIPEDLNRKIEFTARAKKRVKAEVIREALDKGLKVGYSQKSSSAQALLDMAKEAERIAEKFNIKGPKDLSENHDYYTWGGEKRNSNATA